MSTAVSSDEFLTLSQVWTEFGFNDSALAIWRNNCVALGRPIEPQAKTDGHLLYSRKEMQQIKEIRDNSPGDTFVDEDGEWGARRIIARAPYGFSSRQALHLAGIENRKEYNRDKPLPPGGLQDPAHPDRRPRAKQRVVYSGHATGFRERWYFHLGDYQTIRANLDDGVVKWDRLRDPARFKGQVTTRESLPEWAIEQLPQPGKAKRLRDPLRAGLTARDAINREFCETKNQLTGWRTKGLPGLDGERLKRWYEYQVLANGTILRFMVYDADQLQRSKKVVTSIDDARKLSPDKWPTDKELVKLYPTLFGVEGTRRRKQQTSNQPETRVRFDHFRKSGQLKFRINNGVIENDPESVRNLVRRLEQGNEKEWTDPKTDKVYMPHWAVQEQYGIVLPNLLRHTKGRPSSQPSSRLAEGYFHPKKFTRNGKGGAFNKGTITGWPKDEILEYVAGRKKKENKRSLVKGFLERLLAKPVYATEAVKLFQIECQGCGKNLLYEAKKQLAIKTYYPRPEYGPCVWYRAGQDPTRPRTIDFGEAQPVKTEVTVSAASAQLASGAEVNADAIEQTPQRRRRGPATSQETLELGKFCYEQLADRKHGGFNRRKICSLVQEKFDRDLVENEVSIYAKRFAFAPETRLTNQGNPLPWPV